jgi:putative salt-induced outer membrane protein YdiY
LTVVLVGDKTVQSPLSTSGERFMVQGQAVAPSDIVALRDADEQRDFERHLHPNWGQLWAGNASLSFAGTTGNAETQTLVTAVTAARVTNNDKASIYFNDIKSSAIASGVKSETADAIRGGWAYNHNLTKKVFANIFNDYAYDKFQDLNLRFIVGAGIGYHVLKTTHSTLDFLGGFDYERNSYGAVPATVTTPEVFPYKQTRAELFYGDDYSYKMNTTTSLTQSWRMFHNLTDFGDYRLNADISVNSKLTKWLTWNIALSDRYVSKPVAGFKTNDFIYSTGLGVTFAR